MLDHSCEKETENNYYEDINKIIINLEIEN